MSENSPLLTLCAAAAMVYASSKKHTVPPLKEMDENSKFPVKLKPCERSPNFSTGSKASVSKISNTTFDRFAVNTSNELSKKFSYTCRKCFKVCGSYGSEKKAQSQMREHILVHSEEEPVHQSTKLKQDAFRTSSKKISSASIDETSEMSPKSSVNVCSEKPVKTISAKRSKKAKSTFQEPVKKPEMNIHETDDCTVLDKTTDTLKLKHFEHDYAKSADDEPSTANPSVHEAGESKNQKKENYDLSNGCSYVMPPIISTPPFPSVYIPYPLETAQIVELHSNGNPIDYMKSISSGSRITSTQTAENRSKKKKGGRTINASRSVLECVENRVTCKPDTSSEERDARGSDDGIENSENVEKNDAIIVQRNIERMGQKTKRKKKNCVKKAAVCELCAKEFTALASLRIHYNSHLNIKPFRCHLCFRTFTRRHSLKYHLMIHENKNRFECPHCSKLFRHPSHYKEHLRRHTNEIPFTCQFCSIKFRVRNSFKRHLKSQHEKVLTSDNIVFIDNDN